MSVFNYFVEKLKSGIITFINAVALANRDFPYHDYVTFTDTDEPVMYQVGKSNRTGQGDQRKLFVSKSTLIYSDVACTVHFNSPANVAIAILANTLYEFESNISSVYVAAIGTDGDLYMWFEGVLPQETRNPE